MPTITQMDRVDELLTSWREAGEVEALGELLRWQRDRACALACGVLGEQADAEDAVQQAFVKLLSRRKGFEDRTAFTAAVTRAVIQCAIDLLRSRRSRGRHQEAYAAMQTEEQRPEDRLADRERDLAVRAALAGLPEDERLAVLLCCQDGHSVAAGARLLELPRETLRHRLQRGLRRMRSDLTARGLSVGTAAIGAGLSQTAQAASPQLCAALDASLPGPACAAVSAAPAGLGLGAQVALVSVGLGAGLTPLALGIGSLALGAAVSVGVITAHTVPESAAAPAASATDTVPTTPERSEAMNTRILSATLAAAALLPITAKEIPIDQLPQPVVEAVTADGAIIVEAEQEVDDGRTVYEVETRLGTAEKKYEVAADGSVLEVEEEIALAEVPAEILAAVQAAAPGVTLVEAERETEGDEVEWSFKGRDAEGKVKVEVDAAGTVEVERRNKGRKHGEQAEVEAEAPPAPANF
jgi:RNA polymerase sigma-70 factor (ECF subfamily)